MFEAIVAFTCGVLVAQVLRLATKREVGSVSVTLPANPSTGQNPMHHGDVLPEGALSGSFPDDDSRRPDLFGVEEPADHKHRIIDEELLFAYQVLKNDVEAHLLGLVVISDRMLGEDFNRIEAVLSSAASHGPLHHEQYVRQTLATIEAASSDEVEA